MMNSLLARWFTKKREKKNIIKLIQEIKRNIEIRGKREKYIKDLGYADFL